MVDKVKGFDMERAWNCNMRLKTAVKRAALVGISKDEVVAFWRKSARELGYWGSYPNPLHKMLKKNAHLRDNNQPDWYRAWKGEIGAGAQLREIINDAKK